jgi:hypothetical protein
VSHIADGEIVEVVLDVVHVTRDGGEFERVLVQGVFPQGAALPPPLDGASRNVVSVFLGRDMRSIGAFLIETALSAGEVPRP